MRIPACRALNGNNALLPGYVANAGECCRKQRCRVVVRTMLRAVPRSSACARLMSCIAAMLRRAYKALLRNDTATAAHQLHDRRRARYACHARVVRFMVVKAQRRAGTRYTPARTHALRIVNVNTLRCCQYGTLARQERRGAYVCYSTPVNYEAIGTRCRDAASRVVTVCAARRCCRRVAYGRLR